MKVGIADEEQVYISIYQFKSWVVVAYDRDIYVMQALFSLSFLDGLVYQVGES